MIIERKSARAIVVTPGREILLLHVQPPCAAPYWVTPGGGLEPGESTEQALRRELAEEVGLLDFAIGPLLARRLHAYSWGGNTIHQRNELFVVEHARFEPNLTGPVDSHTAGFRWWPLGELLNDTQHKIVPPRLAQVVQRYLDQGAPRGEILLEVDAP